MPKIDLHCDNCFFWKKWELPIGVTISNQDDRLGQCRRYPPFMGTKDEKPKAMWPLVQAREWCGEHDRIEDVLDEAEKNERIQP